MRSAIKKEALSETGRGKKVVVFVLNVVAGILARRGMAAGVMDFARGEHCGLVISAI